MPDIFDYTLLKIIKVFIALFIAVLFLQSGFDKILDFKGNKAYIKSVFSATFLKSFSTVLFWTITFLEVATGILCLIGCGVMLLAGQEDIVILGLELAALTILCLFTGQRIAKEYAGAASLVNYFLMIIFGLYLFSLQG